jgi:hypothetical protein
MDRVFQFFPCPPDLLELYDISGVDFLEKICYTISIEKLSKKGKNEIRWKTKRIYRATERHIRH